MGQAPGRRPRRMAVRGAGAQGAADPRGVRGRAARAHRRIFRLPLRSAAPRARAGARALAVLVVRVRPRPQEDLISPFAAESVVGSARPMFETLTKGFRTAKQRFQGLAELDDATVDEALKDVRTALLEADVGFDVVQDFCQRVKEKAVGVIVKVKASSKEKTRRVTPEDHFVKLCHDELVELMGPVDSEHQVREEGPDRDHAGRPAGLGQDDHRRQAGALPREAAQAPAAGRRRRDRRPATIGRELDAQLPGATDGRNARWAAAALASGLGPVGGGPPGSARRRRSRPASSPEVTRVRWRRGRSRRSRCGETIADGLAGNIEPGAVTFELVRDHVATVVSGLAERVDRGGDPLPGACARGRRRGRRRRLPSRRCWRGAWSAATGRWWYSSRGATSRSTASLR